MERKGSIEKHGSELAPRALHEGNIRDFSFLVPEDVVADILSGGGTSGFAALASARHAPSEYVGALCGRFITGTEYAITSIYVPEEKRRQGVGTFLLDTLAGLLDGMDAQIGIHVVRASKEAVGLIAFLEENGFEEYVSETGRCYLIDLANASRVELPPPARDLSVQPFGRIPGRILRSFDPEQKNGFVPMPRAGFAGKSIDKELSMGIVNEGKLQAFCVVEDYLDKCPIMSGFWVEPGAPASCAMSLIAAVRDAVINKYDIDAQILIPTVNERAANRLERLFPPKAVKEGVVHYKKSA